MDSIEKRRAFITNVLYWVIIGTIGYMCFKYLIALVMPFALAFGVAFVLKPLIKLLHVKTKLRWNIWAVVCVLVFYSTVGVLIGLGAVRLTAWLETVLVRLPSLYTNTVAPALTAFFDGIQQKINLLDPVFVEALDNLGDQIVKSLGSSLSNLSVNAVGFISGIATSVPGILVNVLITIIATFFMAADYPNITSFIVRQLPERAADIVLKVKNQIGEVVGQFLRSYMLIMLITFGELSVGFLILGIDNALAIALLIAVFDIMPVLGTGGIVIPWMVINFILGNVKLGVGLLVVYIVVTVVRNIIEPRIIGKQVGLHPLVTLISMFIGAELFGFIGLFGLPITCAIIKSLNDKGAIHLLKR